MVSFEEVQEYEGALIRTEPDNENWYYHLADSSKEDKIIYVTGSVGPARVYTLEELEEAIENDQVTLATDDSQNEVFHTPDGDIKY